MRSKVRFRQHTVELVCKVNPISLAAVTSKWTAAVTLLGFSSMKLLAATLSGKPMTCRHRPVAAREPVYF